LFFPALPLETPTLVLSKVIDWFKFPRVVVVIPDPVLSFAPQSKEQK